MINLFPHRVMVTVIWSKPVCLLRRGSYLSQFLPFSMHLSVQNIPALYHIQCNYFTIALMWRIRILNGEGKFSLRSGFEYWVPGKCPAQQLLLANRAAFSKLLSQIIITILQNRQLRKKDLPSGRYYQFRSLSNFFHKDEYCRVFFHPTG